MWALAALLALSVAGCGGGSKRLRVDGVDFDLRGLEPQRANVVLAALSQVGTPYVYGGSTPDRALDCSGLTQFAHREAGMQIPRVSTEQRRAAGALRGRPEPGDLVFFRTGPGQYHVGLMVDRERFVHASTSKRRVRLARLDRPYWRQRFLGAGSYL